MKKDHLAFLGFYNYFFLQNNLVCSKKLYRTHAIVFFMAGFTLGSLLIGIFSDRCLLGF